VPPSFLAKSGGAVPSTGRPTPVIPLLVESVVSRLLGRNRRPTVPRVQDPDRFDDQQLEILPCVKSFVEYLIEKGNT
jgi:hypothetical protein